MLQAVITTMPMMVCAILSVFIGLSLSNQPTRPKYALLHFMVTATALYWAHGIFFYRQTELIPFSDTLYSFCNPAVFPLFYIFIEDLTLRKPDHLRQVAYLLPSLVCFITVGSIYYLMDNQETAAFISQYLYRNEGEALKDLAWWQWMAHTMVRIVFALEIPPILFFSWRHISHYNQTIENYYSNTEGKLLTHIRPLVILFAVASFSSFTFNIIGRQQFTDSPELLLIPSLLFSTLLLLIGHVGLKQQFFIKDIIDEDKEDDIKLQPVFNQNRLTEAIKKLIEDEHLYLQPNLKTEDLALRLHTNKNYVYQAINIGMGLSFTKYINLKRIEYAVRLMEENPKALLTEISDQAGFSSASAFYRNFKSFKGCSPSDYLLRLQRLRREQALNSLT